MNEAVVLVHGIWMTGVEMGLLAHRLRKVGYQTHVFHYHSLLRTPAENAARLDRFLDGLSADVIHLVAHSLGGIVVSHLFGHHPDQKPGRVVMMGTPLRGSRVARRYHHWFFTRPLLGRSMDAGLGGGVPRWPRSRQLCMIAGNRGVGVGKLLLPGAGLPEPNDGTVALDETHDAAIHRHLEVPYSHFGMLFSRPVADAVISCLQTGDFG